MPLNWDVLPAADIQQRQFQRLCAAPFLLFQLMKSGIHPSRGDPAAWYDRLIRVVGGIVLSILLVAMVVVGWVEAVKK